MKNVYFNIIISCVLLSAVSVLKCDESMDESLVRAATEGDADLAKNYLDRGADVNAVIPFTLMRPLETATRMLNTDLYRYPMNNPSYLDSLQRYEKTIDVLLEHGADVMPEDFSTVIESGSLSIVQKLARKTNIKVMVDRMGKTPLYVALEFGDPVIAYYLLKEGVDANRAPFTGSNAGVPPLELAIEGYYAGGFKEPRGITLDTIAALIDHGAQLDARSLAAARGNSPRMAELPDPIKKDLLLQLLGRYTFIAR